MFSCFCLYRYQTQDAKMKKLKSEEMSLISKENEWKAEERKPLPPPKYPQPPFNQTKIVKKNFF